ncbi:AfsR/SARP family transcriptional regulator [Glycomyces sp. YM15]|uniref:AfsR/SARP family transcriptional regulator n=1 Tax=Glycomyces sp. YM15 TaxID=2800446 RepID=UPI00196546FF|nr:AfsR/SARP family transcriptional regulator [Glycomyces sp. YM15]
MLGPLEVRIDGVPVNLGGSRQQSVLAALLANAGRPLPRRRLGSMVWNDPPPSAGPNLRTYLRRLRSVLTDPLSLESRVIADRRQVTLRTEPGELDLEVFDGLCRDAAGAREEGDAKQAIGLYDRALRLWRGSPLEGVDTDNPLYATAVELTERRYAVESRRWGMLVEIGDFGAAIGELRAAVLANPFRERLAELLMLALYKDHRRWEALQIYVETRDLMIGELGLEPGPELQRTHRRILEDDLSQ